MNQDQSLFSKCAKEEREASCPVRLVFAEALAEAKEQMRPDLLPPRDRRLAGELCAIAAEVYMLAAAGEGTVRIEGEKVSCRMAAQVYRCLETEHLAHVIERYRTVSHTVRNLKAYLRTALYNAVFELELRSENEFRSEWQEGNR